MMFTRSPQGCFRYAAVAARPAPRDIQSATMFTRSARCHTQFATVFTRLARGYTQPATMFTRFAKCNIRYAAVCIRSVRRHTHYAAVCIRSARRYTHCATVCIRTVRRHTRYVAVFTCSPQCGIDRWRHQRKGQDALSCSRHSVTSSLIGLSHGSALSAAQRPGFSCRLAALANATDIQVGSDSKTQKTPDLARRKAVSYNPVLGARTRFSA
jgi:hypothetical protein